MSLYRTVYAPTTSPGVAFLWINHCLRIEWQGAEQPMSLLRCEGSQFSFNIGSAALLDLVSNARNAAAVYTSVFGGS